MIEEKVEVLAEGSRSTHLADPRTRGVRTFCDLRVTGRLEPTPAGVSSPRPCITCPTVRRRASAGVDRKGLVLLCDDNVRLPDGQLAWIEGPADGGLIRVVTADQCASRIPVAIADICVPPGDVEFVSVGRSGV